jgi:hypothetical protein
LRLDRYTRSPCFAIFRYIVPSHGTPLLNLRLLIFGLGRFDWLRSAARTPNYPIISYGDIIFRRVCKIANRDYYFLHARPSVCLSLYPHGTIQKSVEKIQVSLKSDKNKGYFT